MHSLLLAKKMQMGRKVQVIRENLKLRGENAIEEEDWD
jgi:hypothetical protein